MAGESEVSISNMLNQSLAMIQDPSVETFEKFERRGTAFHAAIYVGLAAVITGLFGLGHGLSGLLENILSTLAGFFIFTGLVFSVGQTQGGSGRFDEVAYTFALFWAPISVGVSIISLVLVITLVGILFLPVVGLAALLINAWFAWLAVQSSMNLRETRHILITLGVAVIGTGILQGIVRWIL